VATSAELQPQAQPAPEQWRQLQTDSEAFMVVLS
jgi:hypothetical protein